MAVLSVAIPRSGSRYQEGNEEMTIHTYTLSTLDFMLIALGLSISTGSAQDQTMSFNYQFTTPEIDRATAVAVDASGIYVVGNRPSAQGSPGRAGVRKYDPLGNELWTREFSAPTQEGTTLIGVAPDASGAYDHDPYSLVARGNH